LSSIINTPGYEATGVSGDDERNLSMPLRTEPTHSDLSIQISIRIGHADLCFAINNWKTLSELGVEHTTIFFPQRSLATIDQISANPSPHILI